MLAGNDDPQLPLVTCSQTTNVYLLGQSIISGDQIQTPSASMNSAASATSST